MKFFKQSLTVFLFALLAMNLNTYAQAEMEWDHHGIGFSVPNDFSIEVNNEYEFSAGNGNIFVTLQPWQDGTISGDQMADACIDVAGQMNYTNLHGLDAVDVHDFVGYAVLGEGDGSYVMVAFLLDTQSSTNLVMSIAFNPGFENTAEAICESLYAYD